MCPIDLERAVYSKFFTCSVVFLSLTLALGTVFPDLSKYHQPGIHASILAEAFASNIYSLILPILAALPYTTAFIDEVQSGFGKFYLIRTTKKKYILSKGIAAWLSGVLCIFFSGLLNYFIYWLVLSPQTLKADTTPAIFIPFLIRIVPVCMTGGLCSLTGALLSTLFMAGYVAYISPFTVFYLLIIINERYLGWLYCIYPREWITPSHNWGTENTGLYLFLLLVTIILIIIYYAAANRRMCDV